MSSSALFDNPRQLLLDMAQVQDLSELLNMAVARLAATSRVALARIWLVRKSPDGSQNPTGWPNAGDQRYLELVASAGQSQDPNQPPWDRLDGAFGRFAMGHRKVGQIALTGQAIEILDLSQVETSWIANPDWARRENIRGFCGQPLVNRGQVLGVLIVFSRGETSPLCMDWLRMIANHMAAAITTARAFGEIATLKKRLKQENQYLREEVKETGAFGDLIGQSPALGAVTDQIALVAPTQTAVLILGESRTGKELVAREVHRRSLRSDKPLIKINCAAVPRELYESEFFGHVKGAFTGALRDRVGRFELADTGTLLLDEIGEIPLDLQAKLLRVLQEGEFERVGDPRPRRVDVRLIAATNRDLKAEAQAGRFRLDLYYRLAVFPIELPPLRQRRQDIATLAEHFLRQHARKLARPVPRLTAADVQQLQDYPWPGNIRELQNLMERAVITARGGRITLDLPTVDAPPATAGRDSGPAASNPMDGILTAGEFRQLEVANIRRALQAAGGKISGPGGAAQRLGLKPTTLASRVKALKIDK